MLEDLFLTETPGESSTSNIEMPEDIEQWPAEIQNILYTQIPELANIPGQLNFDTVEQDKRYAKGSYTVDTGEANGGNNIIFPILVKDGELMPIDIYLYKDEFRPVDTEDISSILMSPEIGDETIDEQDIPSSSFSSFSNRVTPPGSYGSGFVTSYSSKTGSLRDKLVDMINTSSAIKKNLAVNKVAQKHFLDFFDGENTKTASETFSFPADNTAVFSLGNGEFLIKTASFDNETFSSRETLTDLPTLKNWIKISSLDHNKIFKDLKETGMSVVSSNTEKTASNEEFKEVSAFGSYVALNKGSLKPENIDVLGYIKTAADEKRYIALLSNGNYALQRQIYARPASSEKEAAFKFATLKPGETITLQLSDDNEFVPPVKIASVTGFKTDEMEGISVNGKSIRGNLSFIFLKNAGINKPVKAGFIPSTCFVEKNAEAWFVPADYPVLSLNKEEHLIKTAEDNQYSQFLANKGRHSVLPVSMWKVTNEKVALKSGNKDPEFIDKTAALLLINKYDKAANIYDEMQKIASGNVKKLFVPLQEKSVVKKASTRTVKPFTDSQRLAILKIASSLDEGETIDDVLQLNYVNPENLEEFKENLPELRTAENMLAKLLLSTRLGNTTVEEGDVQSVLGSLHDIIRALDSRV